MSKKTKQQSGPAVRSSPMVRRIYTGWIEPQLELPKRIEERSTIILGRTKWFPTDVKCKITVEYSPNAQLTDRRGSASPTK